MTPSSRWRSLFNFSRDGFDGTWVAHPDLVPTAREPFDEILQDHPNQKGRLRPDVDVAAPDLLNFTIEGGEITEDGLRHNINVGLQYLDAWLRGSGVPNATTSGSTVAATMRGRSSRAPVPKRRFAGSTRGCRSRRSIRRRTR